MTFEIWRRLAERCSYWRGQPDVQGVVITHGTDTLEETAFFLQLVLEPGKPVVLTCAMRPATALAADGPQNLVDAVAVAAADGTQGVLAVCAGVVHAALDVRKCHPYRLDAFTSGDAGPVAYVEEGRLRRVRAWPEPSAGWRQAAHRVAARAGAWPRVEIVMNHAGADGAIVRALVAHGVDGIVAAGTGNGTVGRDLEQALLDAAAQGVRVVRSTRCAEGVVLPHSGQSLPDAQGLSPVKARVAMLLALLD
jgi:L-asparaginase